MNDVIQVNQLTKIYSTGKKSAPVRAVDGISFNVRKGEVFGFLGPNGAGKTTTIRMLTGLTRPTSGNANIFGYDLLSNIIPIKKHTGVVPESSNLYEELSAFDNLVFSMQLYGVPRAEWKSRAKDLLMRFRLSEKRNTLFAKLSKGMKRALTIAAALAHHPALVFLDEPTTGLDVMSARNLRQMIAKLRDEGITVFLTTHYLEEVERLCDRIAIIVKGHIVALDSVERLKSGKHPTNAVEVTFIDMKGNLAISRVEAKDGIEIAVRRALDQSKGKRIISVKTIQPTLEDVFIKLTGLNADVMLADKAGKRAQ